MKKVNISNSNKEETSFQNLDKDALDEIKEAFQLFDTQKTNKLDVREIKAAFRALGFHIKKKEIRSLLLSKNGGEKYDSSLPSSTIAKKKKSGTAIAKRDDRIEKESITYDEFVEMVAPHIASRDPYAEMTNVFKLIDEDGTGGISFKDLKKVAMELGENYNDEEIQEMIDEADRDGDGVINEQEFYRVMKKKSGHPLDELDSDSDDDKIL